MKGCADGIPSKRYASEEEWYWAQVQRVIEIWNDEPYREAYLRGLAIVRDQATAKAVRRAAKSGAR